MHVIPNVAYPYSDWGNGVWQQYPMLTNLYGDGFLFTTLRDQLSFETAVQNAIGSDNQLLTISQKPIENAEIDTYGYGLELGDRLRYGAVHHSGSTGSYHAQTARYPDQKLSVVVMSNNGNIWSGYIADKLASAILPEKNIPVPTTLNSQDFTTEIGVEDIIGEYQNPAKGIVRIFLSEGELFWKRANNNPFKLIKLTGGIYTAEQNGNIKIGFSNKDLILLNPGAEPRQYKKLPPFEASRNYLTSLTGEYYSEEVTFGFTLSLNDDLQLIFQRNDDKNELPMEVIQRDAFLLFDYKIEPKYDEIGHVGSLLVSFDITKNLKFIKSDKGNSERLKYTDDNGYIQVNNTLESYGKGNVDVLLTKNFANDNEEWAKLFGGKGYDKASSIALTADGGFLITGSTSSYGNGNYDVWLIKTDAHGKEEWSKTFGDKMNEYGYGVKELANGDFKVKATKQECIAGECEMRNWIFVVDRAGNLKEQLN